MRKMITILIGLMFPLAVQAVPPPVAIPQITTNTAIRQLSSPYCKEGLKGLANAVEKCYKETSDSSVTMDKCILGDITIAKILIQQKQADLTLLDKNPSEIIADKSILVSGTNSYLNFASVLKRLLILDDMPRFEIYSSAQILAYFQQGAEPVYKNIIKNCKN